MSLNFNKVSQIMLQIEQKGKKPTEQLLEVMSKVSPVKFATGNNHGEIGSVGQMYNLVREAKQERCRKKGIYGSRDIEGVISVSEQTVAQDLKSRKSVGDLSTILPGIVRKIGLQPKLDIRLHSRCQLLLMADISCSGNLVLGMDATGGLLDLKDTPHEGKVQHIKITIQMGECVLAYEEGSKKPQIMHWSFCPYVVSERVSHSNTATDIAGMIMDLREYTRSVTGDAYGVESKIDPIPKVIKTDCAMELANGCIRGFRHDSQVDSGKMYNNVVMTVLLWHDYKLRRDDTSIDLRRKFSKETLNYILQRCPHILKWCLSHVYLAMSNFPNRMEKPPVEVRMYREQFLVLSRHVANVMKNEKK